MTERFAALDRSARRLEGAIAGRRLEEARGIVPEFGTSLRSAVAEVRFDSEEAAEILLEAKEFLIRLRQNVEVIRAHSMHSQEQLSGALGYARSVARGGE